MSDRSKPPEGYMRPFQIPADHPTQQEAIAYQWAHHDAIAAKVRRETLEEAARAVCEARCSLPGRPAARPDARGEHNGWTCPAAPLWRMLAETEESSG